MKDKVHVIELEAHKVPEFKEERSKDWIIYGTSKGFRNNYPAYLLDLYNRSAKHNAIINGKVDYVTGGGFAFDTENMDLGVAAKVQKFINHPNKDQTLNDLFDRVALDLEIYNGILFEVIYNKGLKKIASIYAADLNKYRRAKEGGWFYSEEGWKKAKPTDVVWIPDFDANNPSGKQMLYMGEYNPASQVYPIPSYIGCIPYVEMDVEIANFHLNSIKNGFTGGTMVTFYDGVPDNEQKEAIETKLIEKHAGTDNANSILLNFANGRESGGVDIDRLTDNDFDKRFDTLNNQVQQELFSGHRVTDPNLFGIKQDGIFATRGQLVDSYELFKNTYVKGRQDFLLRVFNGLLAVQELPEVLTIKETAPISAQFSEATLVSVMTRDEIREKAGLPKLEEEEIAKEVEMSSDTETKLVEGFSKCGLLLDEYEVVNSRGFHFESDADAEARESELKRFGFIDTAFEMGVLDILRENPTTPFAEIATQLNVTLERIAAAVQTLQTEGYVNLTEAIAAEAPVRALEITPQGERALEETTPLEASFKVAYRYVLSGQASGPEVIDTTRDFCREMVSLSKSRVWTLAEIQQIGFKENRNVWLRKGGFWTRKGTNQTSPYCRHQWEQVTVKVK